MENIDSRNVNKFTTWTFQSGYDPKDVILKQIQQDLLGKTSILGLLKHYMEELGASSDNKAVQFAKMAKLFENGTTPDAMEGHHYGITLCLRTGDQEEHLASVGNILQVLWGATLNDKNPWTGKSFAPIAVKDLDVITLGAFTPGGKVFRGINHFHKIESEILNILSFHLLNLWIGLEPAPDEEQRKYGHEKNGGNFIAAKGRSVYHMTNREVFQLNYRWKNLGNRVPLSWLIDEMVQIAGGLYFGYLLFSTKNILEDYDPARPVTEYDYENFGYFVLLNETWKTEICKLFPSLGIPVNAGA